MKKTKRKISFDGKIKSVPIDLIDPPENPIRDVQPALVNDIRESIKKHGILQNLLLRPKSNGRYEIVFGLQRYYAAKGAGLKEVPAKIRELNEREAIILALSENIQRQTLDPIREGEIMLQLTRGGEKRLIQELSRELGKSIVYIEGRIKLVKNLDEELKKEIGKTLTLTNALYLANFNKQFQKKVFEELRRASKQKPEKKTIFAPFIPTGGSIYCICPICGSQHVRGKNYD